MRTEANRNGGAQARTYLHRVLLAGVVVMGLSSCGGGGDDAVEQLFCDPPPQITSTPPVVATVGSAYRYSVDATHACNLLFVPLRCGGADPIQLPAGAVFLDSSDFIIWTPAISQANANFQFAIASEPDACGRRATQSWTVHVQASVIQSFTAAKSSVAPGESTTLTGVFQGSGLIEDLGAIVSGVPVSTGSLYSARDFTLNVTNSAGGHERRTLTIGILPAVTSTNPNDRATGVPVNHALTAAFNNGIDSASISSATFLLRDASNNPVTGIVTFANQMATFTPTNVLAVLSTYTATITDGVKDAAGNAMAADYVWTFTTGIPDTTPPAVTSTSPANGADRVAPENIGILVTFSEGINPNSVNSSTFILKDASHNPVNGVVRLSNGGKTAEFMPSTALAPTTSYTAIVTTGIRDLAGNMMTADYSWVFVTGTLGSWRATSTTGAPSGRAGHAAVWTGSEMIVWGGWDGSSRLNSGARYNPVTDAWLPISTAGAPSARNSHTTVWTGSEMIVWGGYDGGPSGSTRLNSGARYNPVTDVWAPTSTIGAPSGRAGHTAVWTGSEMIIWGGYNGSNGFLSSSYPISGARYDPATDTWRPMITSGAPSGRWIHTAVWTGSEMIVWGGGSNAQGFQNTGARYNPVTDDWAPTSNTGAPTGRNGHTAVWTGSEMFVWGGGYNDSNGQTLVLDTGGRYRP